jgi:hypothetical protein
MEPISTILIAGAAVLGSELIKEATKDAYRNVKRAAGKLLGTQAEQALDAIEKAPEDQSAHRALASLLESLSDENRGELRPVADALSRALTEDQAANSALEASGRFKLDVDAGRDVTLEYIDGVRDMDIKAKAGQDFTLRGVRMGGQRGN